MFYRLKRPSWPSSGTPSNPPAPGSFHALPPLHPTLTLRHAMKSSTFAARALVIIGLAGFTLTGLASRGHAQSAEPVRFGVGAVVMASTVHDLGLGAHGRLAFPVNADVSVSVDLGFVGFLLSGSDDAPWVFTPQISGIVTLPGVNRAPYILVGAGAYLPTSNAGTADRGPTIHAGVGRVQPLTEATFFYEINPGLIVRDDGIDLLVPIRIGVIF